MDLTVLLIVFLINFQMLLGSVFDNQGQEFIVAFMANTGDEQNLELFVATMVDHPVNVTVSTPKYTGNAYLNQQFQISRGNTTMVSIEVELRMEGSSLSPKGILVQATDEVIVYGVNRQHNTNDAFLGLPVDVLGNEYYAVSYLPKVVSKSIPQYSQLMVVASVDGTQVEITFPDSNDFDHVIFDGKEYYGGQTLNVTLNRCDSLQLQAEGYYDLTGAYLKSDKPVAFFSGNVRAVVGAAGSSDHLVEQLMSTDRWGKRFVIVPIPERDVGDYFKVTGNTDATEVDFTCISSISMIKSDKIILAKAGSYQLVEMNPRSYCYIVANNSVLIVYFVKSQYNNDNHDPALILIPPIEQYAAEYVFTTPKKTDGSYENFFLFVVNDKDKDGLRLDGEPFPSTIDYVSVPNSSLVAGYMVVEDGFHKFNHISPISVFGGIMYGRFTFETYGLPVGLRMAKINQPCNITEDEIGDGVDNDCDGLIDEELCTGTYAGQDDDGDDKVDEDCAQALFGTEENNESNDWAEWSTWGECVQTRNRTCTVRNTGASYCSGPSSESFSCEKAEPAVSTSTASTEVIQVDLGKIMKELDKTLRLGRKSTSKYRRSLQSASDDRTSCTVIGYVCISILAAITSAFLLVDLRTYYDQLRHLHSGKV